MNPPTRPSGVAKNNPAPPAIAVARVSPVERLHARFGAVETIVERRISAARAINNLAFLPLRPEFQDEAEILCRRIPCRADLHEQACALLDAIRTPATAVEAKIIVAVTLDSIPGAKTQSGETYADALVFELLHPSDEIREDIPGFKGFSSAVLYGAGRRVRRTARFAPTIGEMIDAALEEHRRYDRAVHLTRHLTELRCNAESVIDAFTDDADVPFDDDDEGGDA